MAEGNFWTRNRISRRTALRGAGLGVAGLAGAALIGCGDDDDDDAARATAAPAATAAPGAAATEAPAEDLVKTGGTYRTAYDGTAPHFSPFHPGIDPSWPNTFRRNTGYYDSLWHLRDIPEAALQYYPRLAETFERIDDLTVVVTLVRANFHDNPKSSKFNSIVGARQIDAEDVKARLEYMAVPPASSNSLVQDRLTTTAVDASTVRFDSTVPEAFFLEGNEGVQVRGTELPKEMLDETVLKEEEPIGTGPYMFDSYQVGSVEKAVRNPNYWFPDHPFMAAKQYTIMADNAAQEAAFRANAIDAHSHQDIKEAESVKRDLGDRINVRDYASGSGQVLMLNILKAPFNDIRFREAIYRAINRQRVMDVIYFGDATFEGYFTQAVPSRFPIGWDALKDRLDYDPERARQLVQATKDDGTYDGRELHFMLPVEAQTWVDGGRLMAEDLEAVGIKVRTEPIVRNIYLGRAGPKGEGGSASDFDITMTVFLAYHHHSSRTGSFWTNASLLDPEVDDLIDKITSTVDSEEREALSHQWENMLADKYSNFVPVLGINSHRSYYAFVQGTDFDKSRSG